MAEYVKWRCDWNRPLSREEREIARRLDRAPDKDSFRNHAEPRSYYEQELDSAPGGSLQVGGEEESSPGETAGPLREDQGRVLSEIEETS